MRQYWQGLLNHDRNSSLGCQMVLFIGVGVE